MITVLLVFLLLISCTETKEHDSRADFNEKILDFVVENSEDIYVELPEIYNATSNNIPNDKDEKIFLAQKLKDKGFKVTGWGRGNYPPSGPRIIMLTLKKGNCECEVDKVYYATLFDSEYVMTERIKCKKVSR